VLLEVSSRPFLIGTTHVSDNGMACHLWGIFFFFFFLSSSLKSTTWLFLLLVFKLRSLFFWFLIFFSFALLEKFYWFSISSFNLKLWYYFFQFDPCCFDFYFFSWSFCKSFICFQFHPSIHICGILFLPIWPSFFLFFFC
jgi:hypothetical protein